MATLFLSLLLLLSSASARPCKTLFFSSTQNPNPNHHYVTFYVTNFRNPIPNPNRFFLIPKPFSTRLTFDRFGEENDPSMVFKPEIVEKIDQKSDFFGGVKDSMMFRPEIVEKMEKRNDFFDGIKDSMMFNPDVVEKIGEKGNFFDGVKDFMRFNQEGVEKMEKRNDFFDVVKDAMMFKPEGVEKMEKRNGFFDVVKDLMMFNPEGVEKRNDFFDVVKDSMMFKPDVVGEMEKRSDFFDGVKNSVKDRTMDVMSVVGALVFGMGCGALTAGTMYLGWSLFVPNRFQFEGEDEDQEFDDDLYNTKKMAQNGYVAISDKVVDDQEVKQGGEV